MKTGTLSLKILTYVLGLLLVISVFKNISYPLLWADESMTAVCSERVIKYGYPKVHDGKNTVNDMFCSTPKVAVNAKDDAFIGGANWGQYYYGVIGYLLAANSVDLYTKTGIFRSTFAIIGLLGIFLVAFAMAKFLEDKFYKYLFVALFLFTELISMSLILHLREVRYYSPTLFFNSAILCLYLLNRFHKKIYNGIHIPVLAILLWILFNMFSPLYFIIISAIGLTEIYYCISQYLKIKKWKEAIMPSLPSIIAVAISLLGVIPLLSYFQTFQMKAVLDNFYHFNSALYRAHLGDELRYFSKLDLLWLAIFMRIVALWNYSKNPRIKSKLFKVSNFLSLLFVISFFASPNIDSPMFTRYIIYMQPVVAVTAIFDFIYLLKKFSAHSSKFWNRNVTLLTIVFILLFGFTLGENLPYLEGHIYEMTHQYKGPLDYTIPYIKSNYPKPEDLIIATNYEESSFIYYLHSKVVVGFVGNNLPEDTIYQPDIISYRQSLGSNFDKVFNGYLSKAIYRKITFPVKDLPLNNIPELNFEWRVFNHYFQTVTPQKEGDEERLLIKDGIVNK